MSREVDPNTVDISVAIAVLYSRLPDLDQKFFQSVQNAYARQYEKTPKETFHILSKVGTELCEKSWKCTIIATTNDHLLTSFREGLYVESQLTGPAEDDPDDSSGRN